MIGYVTFGSNDLARGAAFYDELLGELGAKRVMDMGRIILWGNDPAAPMLALCVPHDEGTATVGNGVMVALNAGSAEMVNKLYAKAIELGAADEGEPGPRGDSFYGGYFRDLDGNKLVAFSTG